MTKLSIPKQKIFVEILDNAVGETFEKTFLYTRESYMHELALLVDLLLICIVGATAYVTLNQPIEQTRPFLAASLTATIVLYVTSLYIKGYTNYRYSFVYASPIGKTMPRICVSTAHDTKEGVYAYTFEMNGGKLKTENTVSLAEEDLDVEALIAQVKEQTAKFIQAHGLEQKAKAKKD